MGAIFRDGGRFPHDKSSDWLLVTRLRGSAEGVAISDVALVGTDGAPRLSEAPEDEEAPGDWLPGTGKVQAEASCVLDEVWQQFVSEDEEEVMGALLIVVNEPEIWVPGGPVAGGDGSATLEEGAAFGGELGVRRALDSDQGFLAGTETDARMEDEGGATEEEVTCVGGASEVDGRAVDGEGVRGEGGNVITGGRLKVDWTVDVGRAL